MENKMKNDINFDKIGIEIEDDILFITISKYKLFLSRGSVGIDALSLYLHLMFTARLQKTNQVKAKNIYLKKGLRWGKERLLKAKNLLYELNLIELIQKRDENGKFTESYLKVKTRTFTGGPETGDPQNRLPDSDHKCLNEKEKCLNEKQKPINKKNDINKDISKIIFDFWDNLQNVIHHKNFILFKDNIEKQLKKPHNKNIDDIKKTMQLYNEILSSDLVFVGHKYRWSIVEFLSRGVPKFLDKTIEDFYDKSIKSKKIPANKDFGFEKVL
jgi:hypothetical protein